MSDPNQTFPPTNAVSPVTKADYPMLRWPAGVVMVGFVLAEFFLVYQEFGESDIWFARGVGAIVAGLAFAGFLAWIVRRLIGRRKWTGTAVFSCVLVLVAIGSVSQRNEREFARRSDEARRAVENTPALADDEQAKYAAEAGRALKILDSSLEVLENRAQNESGESAKVFGVLAEFGRSMQPQMQAFAQAMQAFYDSGSVDLTGVSEPAQIEERLILAKRASKEANAAFDYVKSLPQEIVKRLEAAGVAQSEINEARLGLEESLHVDLLIEVQKSNQRFVESCIAYLSYLKDKWGRWEHDNDSGQMSFEDESEGEAYNLLVDEMGAVATELEEVSQRVAARKSRNRTAVPQ